VAAVKCSLTPDQACYSRSHKGSDLLQITKYVGEDQLQLVPTEGTYAMVTGAAFSVDMWHANRGLSQELNIVRDSSRLPYGPHLLMWPPSGPRT
jgi:hypothetical protein